MLTALEFMLSINKLVDGFWSKERPAQKDTKTGLFTSHCSKASNSEIRRWLENKAILINGVACKPNDVIEFPITSLVLFPKGNKITLR